MKKLLLICILLALVLPGCAREAAAPAAEAAPTAVAVTMAPVTAAPTAVPEQQISIDVSMQATDTPAPLDSPTPAPTPSPTATPEAAPTPFSLVVIPDTQALAYHHPEAFPLLRDWIEGHREDDNILGILHTGDMVDNGFKDWEWENIAPLLEAAHDGVFLLPVAGNHDIGTTAKSYSAYLKQPFLDAYPAEQRFEGGKMLYRVLSAGGQDMLLLGVGWDSYLSNDAKRWLDQVMTEHGSMPCILITHGFLRSNGTYIRGVDQLIARYPAIRLVICGHARAYQTRVFSYDDDGDGIAERTVNVLMLNMQDRKDYAFRLLTFDPSTRSIHVSTWMLDGSPAKEIPDAGPVSFTLERAY